jgi:hypothetical protein
VRPRRGQLLTVSVRFDDDDDDDYVTLILSASANVIPLASVALLKRAKTPVIFDLRT